MEPETRYYYDGWKIAETRVGGTPTTYHQQFIHGTQYIDELIMVRALDKGDLYIHQDANWNVIGTTDLAASIVERNVYTPYGQLTVNQETSYCDRDGDGDVDATDKGTPGTTCTGTVSGACRILDLDFDGDYDSTDATNFDLLTQGIARHPGRTTTATNQPFAHQGLLFEPELGSYQNRARQYSPGKRRFVQRDPISTSGIFGFEMKQVQLFEYVASNPTILSDPTGLSSCSNMCTFAFNGANSNVAAVTKCCYDNGLGACRAKACINPKFPPSPALTCLGVHESYHERTIGCKLNPCFCTPHLDGPYADNECEGNKRQYNCSRQKNIPKLCSYSQCVVNAICGTSTNEAQYLAVINNCEAFVNAGGGGGCARPEYPEDGK